jgi:hypothetical protein
MKMKGEWGAIVEGEVVHNRPDGTQEPLNGPAATLWKGGIPCGVFKTSVLMAKLDFEKFTIDPMKSPDFFEFNVIDSKGISTQLNVNKVYKPDDDSKVYTFELDSNRISEKGVWVYGQQ